MNSTLGSNSEAKTVSLLFKKWRIHRNIYIFLTLDSMRWNKFKFELKN